ncbi:MAG TPA: glycerophosphodiester phosphodiesterase [Polyangium sp.]|nr:glycerophosphodiester phosphodiesterase [Polyangium sp.]
MTTRYVDGPKPRLFGHRGASGTMPENTLAAFSEALAAGADRLEMDVHLTADEEVIVLHDHDLDRTTDGRGPAARLRLSEIRGLDAGYQFESSPGTYPFRGRKMRIPTFAEVLAHFSKVPINVELKVDDPALVEAMHRILARHEAKSRVLLTAESQTLMERIRLAMPDVLTGMCASEVLAFWGNGGNPGYRTPGFALQVPVTYAGIPIVTQRFVDVAHEANLEVHVWVINEEDEMRRLLDMGVDGIMTDFPRLAAKVLGRTS